MRSERGKAKIKWERDAALIIAGFVVPKATKNARATVGRWNRYTGNTSRPHIVSAQCDNKRCAMLVR